MESIPLYEWNTTLRRRSTEAASAARFICALGCGSSPSPSIRITLGSCAGTMAVSIITVASLRKGARNDCTVFSGVLGSQLYGDICDRGYAGFSSPDR